MGASHLLGNFATYTVDDFEISCKMQQHQLKLNGNLVQLAVLIRLPDSWKGYVSLGNAYSLRCLGIVLKEQLNFTNMLVWSYKVNFVFKRCFFSLLYMHIVHAS